MYIRVKVTPSLDESIVTMALNPGWVEHDGFYYYRYPVKPGWTTVPLMNRICFSGENMTNEHQGAEYTLTLQPEAVQTTNGAPFELWGVYPYTLGGNSNRSADPTIVPEDYGLSTEAAPVLDFEGEITGYDNE